MEKIFDGIANNMPAVGAAGTQASLGVVGATGQIPPGIHPIFWALITIGGPLLTALIFRYARVRDARKKARLQASAAELRRCAEQHERQAQLLLADADAANDADAVALVAKARLERIEAAADEGEAAQIEREAERRNP